MSNTWTDRTVQVIACRRCRRHFATRWGLYCTRCREFLAEPTPVYERLCWEWHCRRQGEISRM